MPTTKKKVMFLSSFFLSLVSLILICYILAAQGWVTSSVTVNDNFLSGKVVVSYGLFRGHTNVQLNEGIGENNKNFDVLPKLKMSTSKVLLLLAVLGLAVSLAASLLSSSFTLYNSVSNPYQTFLGPVGVYTWSGLGAASALLAMILFAASTLSELSEQLVEALYASYPASTHRGTTHSYGAPFWLLLLIMGLDVGAVVIIVFYQKARYQQEQEQRKPMESAPRDGILF
ncbi:PREDICTED: clarin-3 [Condylura cristata]|uniref:clarin-3 n=1 Tax=Condylura cristata TaxID=143302 RepID=UPI00033467B2|nr:PREDICTED: clarin-3 [Condylura cristata]